jgi:hypothetical protein
MKSRYLNEAPVIKSEALLLEPAYMENRYHKKQITPYNKTNGFFLSFEEKNRLHYKFISKFYCKFVFLKFLSMYENFYDP